MNKTTYKLQKPRYLTKGAVIKEPPQSQAVSQVSSMETIERRSERDIDKEYLVRALSHDVGAHLMLLEFSFRHYDELARRLAGETQPKLLLASNDQKSEKSLPQTKRLQLASLSQEPTVLGQAASHVTACVDEMKRFVNELISFAKTGSIDMEPSAVNIAKLVDEVLFEQRRLVEKRKIEVVVSSPLPTVFANPMRIKQVLTNLIRNAAIHGCDSKLPIIVIAPEWTSESANNTMAGFSVRDNGCGIPQAECARLFDPGYRVSGNQNKGSGIGLAIVKKIIDYYGGNVICQSNGNDATFVVTLPKAKSQHS